tara:strand:+ start:10328 stop:10717 length:390 start_codon:yes stop_codon:yes gene_type:complete
MSVKITSNLTKQANRMLKMTGPDAEMLTGIRLLNLARAYVPIFAASTPKSSGTAAASITVKQERADKDTTIVMQWGTDYIDDVNAGDGENAGFADQQFKSIKNRLNVQAKREIGDSFKIAGKKNKLKVR